MLTEKKCFSRGLAFFSLLLAVGCLVGWWQSERSALPAVSAAPTRTVILDAGHGGSDGGTVGVNGALEKDLNLLYVKTLADLFREAGVNVILTRTEDELVLLPGEENATGKKKKDLANRLSVARANPDALFVSIHMNSYPSAKVSGLQVWCAKDKESRAVAGRIQENVRANLQPDNTRAVKEATSAIYLLHNAVTPSVLVECGFLSSPEEAGKLCREDYRKELCFLIFCAIMEEE